MLSWYSLLYSYYADYNALITLVSHSPRSITLTILGALLSLSPLIVLSLQPCCSFQMPSAFCFGFRIACRSRQHASVYLRGSSFFLMRMIAAFVFVFALSKSMSCDGIVWRINHRPNVPCDFVRSLHYQPAAREMTGIQLQLQSNMNKSVLIRWRAEVSQKTHCRQCCIHRNEINKVSRTAWINKASAKQHARVNHGCVAFKKGV